MDWDVFISHAWEDKESFARPLAKALEEKGLHVWFDEFTISVGDKLRRSIDYGLANSKYGIVILSPNFFAKEWPQKELDGLASREVAGEKVILPVWHNITTEQIRRYSPMLADRVAVSSDRGLDYVVMELLRAIRPFEKSAGEESTWTRVLITPTRESKSLNIPSKSLMDFTGLLDLRDHILFSLGQPVLARNLKMGDVEQLMNLDGEQIVVVATFGVGLFDLRKNQALWKINRYARCGAINSKRDLLALVGWYSDRNEDREIDLWDTRNGLIRHTLSGHMNQVNSLDFSPDGEILASGADDKTVRLWEIEDGKLLDTLECMTEVNSVAFSPSGRLLALGLNDSSVELWKIADRVRLRKLAWHKGRVNSVAFSPNGQILASSASDNTVMLWRVVDGSRIFTLVGHEDSVSSVVFSHDGRILASGSSDKTVRLWRVADATILQVLKGHSGSVKSVVFSSKSLS